MEDGGAGPPRVFDFDFDTATLHLCCLIIVGEARCLPTKASEASIKERRAAQLCHAGQL